MSPEVPVPTLVAIWVSYVLVDRKGLIGAIEISGIRYFRLHAPVQLVGRQEQIMVPHKKNIPGVRIQQLKLRANRSLSGNLLIVPETDSELTRVAPTGGVFAPYAEGSLPEKVGECPAVPET